MSSQTPEAVLDPDELPRGWIYDPGWVWPGVCAAIHDDAYPVAPEPEYDTEVGYLIEVDEGQTEATLFRNNKNDRHTRIDSASLEGQTIADAVAELIESAGNDREDVLD